jgi:anti-sigma B factor antagonist
MHNGRPELPALPVAEIVRLGTCELRIHQLAGCVVVRPAGEIDLSNTDALRGHLSSLVERGHVVLDLSGVSFLDSTALGVLITVRRRAADRGTSIHLAGAYGTALRVLQITGLDAHLDLYGHVADAIEAALRARTQIVGRNGRARLDSVPTGTDRMPNPGPRFRREDDDLGPARAIEGAPG